MKKKFKDGSNRLRGWDHGANGYYIVTICTKNRFPWFGKLTSEGMFLNNVGIIARDSWGSIPSHIHFALLDEFCVMPNHLHGIVIIKNHEKLAFKPNSFGPQSKNLGSIIRSFKGFVTKKVRKQIDPDFSWQPRFYDQIIRNEQHLNNIQQYILNNAEKHWAENHVGADQ